MVHKVVREHSRETAKAVASSEKVNIASSPKGGVIHRYNPETNMIVARSRRLDSNGGFVMLGTFRMAGPHHVMEMDQPKVGDNVILFSAPPPLKYGFAFLDHDASSGAWSYARVGGEMYVSPGD